MIERKVVKIQPKIGSMSLVGVYGEVYPFDYGNYFSFVDGTKCTNLWAENLQELVRRDIISGDLDVEVTYHDHSPQYRFGRVVDPRIPENWFNEPCITGCACFDLNKRDLADLVAAVIT